MTQDIKDFFEALPGRAEGKTAGVNSTYVFDIEGAGTWTVAVTDEGATVTEGDQGGIVHDRGLVGDVLEDRRRRAERHDRLHDGQAEDQGRHGRGDEAPEALLGDAYVALPARTPAHRVGRQHPRPHRRRLAVRQRLHRAVGLAAARRGGARVRQRLHQADPRDPHAAADHLHARPRVLRDQRRDARARRVGRAGVLDRRLLDVRRRDDRRVVRELRRRPRPRLRRGRRQARARPHVR